MTPRDVLKLCQEQEVQFIDLRASWISRGFGSTPPARSAN